MIGRRGLFRAAPLLLFAPAIVRAASLMPVSVLNQQVLWWERRMAAVEADYFANRLHLAAIMRQLGDAQFYGQLQW